MKRIYQILILLFTTMALIPAAQAQDFNSPKYLAGAVPEENGYVVFRKSYECPGLKREQIHAALDAYAKQQLKSEVHLVQCRITQTTPEDGIVAASMEETLIFKSTAWVLDSARFFYQIVYTARDGGFDVMLRRIHYIYEPMEVQGVSNVLSAEDWITDKEALKKNGQLRKIGGKKFRRATIDRKDAIFEGAYQAVMRQ